MNICDYLKKERTTIEALTLKIGVSNSSLRNLLKGGQNLNKYHSKSPQVWVEY